MRAYPLPVPRVRVASHIFPELPRYGILLFLSEGRAYHQRRASGYFSHTGKVGICWMTGRCFGRAPSGSCFWNVSTAHPQQCDAHRMAVPHEMCANLEFEVITFSNGGPGCGGPGFEAEKEL